MNPIAPPRGTRDLLPDEAPAWRWFHETHAAVAGRHGYQLIDTPVFEATELFSRGVGSGTDIVDKEMYTFTDRGGRSMTLRPEGTAPVLRAVLGAHLEQQRRPVRVHYAMSMFRYDRPQAGRYRQFHQVGIELIGERDPCYDAEVIEVAWRFMAELRIDGVDLQVNRLGDREDRLRYREALVAYYTPLRDRLCDDCQRRLDVNPLRLLDCKKDARYVETRRCSATTSVKQPRVLRRRAVTSTTPGYRTRATSDWCAGSTTTRTPPSSSGTARWRARRTRSAAAAAMTVWRRSWASPRRRASVMRSVSSAPQGRRGPGRRARAPTARAAGDLTAGERTRRPAAARELRNRTSVITDLTDRRLDKKLRDAGRLGALLALLVGMEDGLVLRNLRTRKQQVVSAERCSTRCRRSSSRPPRSRRGEH